MVSDTVLRALDAAVVEAGNRRNEIQFEINDLRMKETDAKAAFQRAQNQEDDAARWNDQKVREHSELLSYYNSLVDKTGLDAIANQIEALAEQQREVLRRLGEARRVRQDRYRELEQAKTALAIAEGRLPDAIKEWQRVSEQAQKAREEH